MRSFAAIATFATLAFSALTSALPTPRDITANVDVLGLVDLKADIDVCLNVDINAIVGVDIDPSPSHPIGGGPKGIADVLVNVNAEILPLMVDLNAKIDADVDVNVLLNLALDVFAKVKVIIGGACDDITAIVNADINVVLNLDGKPITVSVVAKLLAQVLNLILVTVGLVVKICVDIDVSALLKIVADIVVDLTAIIHLVVKVAADITVDLKGLLDVVAHICVDLHLDVIVKVFVNLLGINVDVNAVVNL